MVDKDLFMKGAELYSWRDQGGYVWYALLPGTNRTKGTKELTDSKVSSGYLKHVLKSLPSKTPVLWNNLVGVADKSTLEFSLPDDTTLKEILKSAEVVDLKITIVK
ncbi:MAG: hypothetical protein JNJ49_10135 [Bdellovibrionaceae bacterium]|nr:hypothetical protein [Pseudobdellovibrionaceae bacterium]